MRLPRAEREALDRLAELEDVPASTLARQAIRRELERRQQQTQGAS